MPLPSNTKIQPLIEDLGRIVPGEFLTTTEFKRWLVEHNLDEAWSLCLKRVKENRRYVVLGFNHDVDDARDTLSLLVTFIFEKQKETLIFFLFQLLSFYAKENTIFVDTLNIKKDLLAAGFTNEDVSVLDKISIPDPIKERIEDVQTQEQMIRSMEDDYLAIPDENSSASINAYLKWHSATLLYLSDFYTETNPDYSTFKHLDNSGNGYTLRQNYKSIYSIYNLLMNSVTTREIADTSDKKKKTPMVFISHSHEDEDFIKALVNLLEDIGFDKSTLFCSSIREYGIPIAGDIFETILGLFHDHDLYVIFVHSPRFYKSAVSLNEMGAAWVLKNSFCSLLTNDMSFDQMKGVVNNAKISIKVNDKDAPLLLNDLYKHLTVVFSLQEMDMNKWERKRDQFLQITRGLKNEVVEPTIEENSVDMEYKKLQIEKMKTEAEIRLKAIIRGNIVKGFTGGRSTLRFFNAGYATARNVRVEWLNECSEVICKGDFSSIGELTPQNSRSYPLLLVAGHPETMSFRYLWDDDFRSGNQLEETLQL